MKAEHKDLSPVELALLTWYKPDNDKYNDPLHPTMKLAGEVGELLDLYAKHLFKPGFDWMNCKWCKDDKEHHGKNSNRCWYNGVFINKTYTPLVLDELGDIWYYLRILAWQNEIDLSIADWSNGPDNNLIIIKKMYDKANYFMKYEFKWVLQEIYFLLLDLLYNLDYTIDQLTELNYIKLNSDNTNHGWANAL